MPATFKYFAGKYALCPRCDSRPCMCGALAPTNGLVADPSLRQADAAPIVSLVRPASGRAIPFAVWDTVIPRYELSVIESSVLLYLCRETIGRGMYHGDAISLTQVGAALRLSEASVRRALNVLDRHGLIVRTRRHEVGRREYAVTHITVTLPAEVPSV